MVNDVLAVGVALAIVALLATIVGAPELVATLLRKVRGGPRL